MGKTNLTLEIEQALRDRAKQNYTRYAFEVPIGKGICDFVTASVQYSNHSIPHITCYEIKVSFSDYYYSDNGANFDGDENYYVMPEELIDEIIKKKANEKFTVGLISYKDGKFKKLTDGKRHGLDRKYLSIENRFKLMDTMLMRILSTGQ